VDAESSTSYSTETDYEDNTVLENGSEAGGTTANLDADDSNYYDLQAAGGGGGGGGTGQAGEVRKN